jgi:ketosteroid isomerase-like protein
MSENLAILRRGYEAFNRGDVSEVAQLTTVDVEWGATGAFPGVDGVYRGPGAMQEWVDLIRSEWEAFEVTLGEILHDEDDLLVVCELLRGRGRSSHAEVEMRVFSVYRLDHGKVRKRQAFTEREAALDAAGLSE